MLYYFYPALGNNAKNVLYIYNSEYICWTIIKNILSCLKHSTKNHTIFKGEIKRAFGAFVRFQDFLKEDLRLKEIMELSGNPF